MVPTAELARLDAAPGYRLTIIIDPEGETKDAALKSWVRHQRRPVAWMRLDAADTDPQRFFPRLQACLQEAGFVPAALPPAKENPIWEDYLTNVLNDASGVEGDFFLILDDYQFISSEEIHQALGWVLDYIPERMHLIITSRQPLPLPVPRLRLRRHLLEIDLNLAAR